MHHLLCKSILLLSIILAIVATSTPNWTDMKGPLLSGHSGLFNATVCFGGNCTTESSSDTPDAIKNCQGLAISSIVFLFLALICDFIPLSGFEQQLRMVGMASYIIGVILMIACVSLYADKVQSDDKKDASATGGSASYGYSFYLAIVSLLLTMGAGVCRGIEHKK